MSSIGRKIAVGSPVETALPADHLWRLDRNVGGDIVFSELNGATWTDETLIEAAQANNMPSPFALTNDLRFVVTADTADLNPEDWGLGRRSKNAGVTWGPTPQPPGLTAPFGIATYARDVNGRIYCGTGDSHETWVRVKLYYSDDEGDTWVGPIYELGSGASSEQALFWKILPDPVNVNRIVLVLQTNGLVAPGAARGCIVKSDDRGATWDTEQYSGTFNIGQGGVRQYYDQILTPSGRIIALGPYQGASGWHHMYSDDFGESWIDTNKFSSVTNHLTLGFFHNRSFTKIAFIHVDLTTNPRQMNLYVSTDLGATFNDTPLDGDEWEDGVWADLSLQQNFAFSAERDALYIRGSGAGDALTRLSPVSEQGVWTNLSLNNPLGTSEENNMQALP